MCGIQALEGAPQGDGGVLIPGGVEERTGHGTQCPGPVDMAVLGQRLDLTILEVFF